MLSNSETHIEDKEGRTNKFWEEEKKLPLNVDTMAEDYSRETERQSRFRTMLREQAFDKAGFQAVVSVTEKKIEKVSMNSMLKGRCNLVNLQVQQNL